MSERQTYRQTETGKQAGRQTNREKEKESEVHVRATSAAWKRWEDNIRKWTGLEFGKSQRAVENREKWRKLVAKSSVVPQRPSRLRY